MKRKFVIILLVQSFFILIAMIYAYVQKGIADENLIEANKQRIRVEQQMKQVDELRLKLENCR